MNEQSDTDAGEHTLLSGDARPDRELALFMLSQQHKTTRHTTSNLLSVS